MYLTKKVFRIYSEVHNWIIKGNNPIKLNKRFEETISTKKMHKTRFLTALLIGEMQIKITVRHCYIYNRMDKTEETNAKCICGCGATGILIQYWCMCNREKNTLENSLESVLGILLACWKH